MYFDAYLKSRNLPNPHLHSQVIHPPSNDFASKFTTLRPPLPQSNPVIGKQTYHEQRNDSSKLNTSAHIYLSTNKPNPIPQRNAANYQGPPSTASGPLGPFSRHQFTQEQRYVCPSPPKGGSRTSAGLVFEEIPQNRYEYRRSESIAQVKPGEAFRDKPITYYNPAQRHATDPSASTSPLEVKFSAFAGKVLRKESDGPLLTNREERPQPPYVKQPISHKKLFKESHAELFQNKSQIPTFDPNKFEYIPSKADPNDFRKYEYQPRKSENEVKKVDAYRTFQEICKNSATAASVLQQIDPLRKQSSLDLIKKYSTSKLDLDKSIDHDIQSLRYANKKADEIVDREMTKNTYLNQLFQQKGLRKQEKGETNEMKEDIAKNIAFEKEIQAKNRQLQEITAQLQARTRDDKANSELIQRLKGEIEDKNKIVNLQRIQLQRKEREMIEKEKQHQETVKILQGKYSQSETQRNQYQLKLKELASLKSQLEERQKHITDLLSKDILEKNSLLEDRNISIAQKNKQLQALRVQLVELKAIVTRHEQSQNVRKSNSQQLFKKSNEKDTKIADLQSKLQQQSKQIDFIKQQWKKETEVLEKQLALVTHTNHEFDQIIKDLQQSVKDAQNKTEQFKSAYDALKQQSQIDKMSLINLYKKDSEAIKAKFELERQTYLKSSDQSSIYIQAEVVELRQRASLAEQELLVLSKQHKHIKQGYELLKQQYNQVGSLLLLEDFTHEAIISRLRECMQAVGRNEGMQSKQIQRIQETQLLRLQQEHLQRRHLELGRELKKVGGRLAGASLEAQQSARLLKEANLHIFQINLMNLNEKYRFLLENQ